MLTALLIALMLMLNEAIKDIASLKSDVASLEGDIASLESEVLETGPTLEDLKALIGDKLRDLEMELQTASLNRTVLEGKVTEMWQELANITALLQDISATSEWVKAQTERVEERAAVERATQQRQMSELLQLTEAVLAHQPPRPSSD